MQKFIDNIRKFQKAISAIDYDKMIDRITVENKNQLIDTNTKDQLYTKGQLSNGEYLPSYSAVTVFLKRSGQGDKRVSNMTLKDEGDFYNAFDLKVTSEGYELYSGDWKAPDLVRRYGKEIFGLTDDNLQEHINKLYKPEMIRLILEKINSGVS